MKQTFLRVCTVTNLLLLSPFMLADEYHYNNLLIGKDAVGMGGAYTAVGDDLSSIYYNPAALTRVGDSNMASINTFAWEQTTFNNVFGNSDDFKRSAFSIVPGFFGISYNTNSWTLGAALMVTDYSQERSDDEIFYQSPAFSETAGSTNNEFITIDIDNSAYQIVGAAAKQINENFSIGLGLGIEYRTFQTTQSSGTVVSTSSGELSESASGFQASARYSDDNILMIPSVSMLYQDNAWSLGAKIAKSIVVQRNHEFVSAIFLTGVPADFPDVVSAARLSESACCKQKYPFNINVGAAYKTANWLFSADLQYFEKVDEGVELLEVFGSPVTKVLDEVVNVALGMAYTINRTDSIKFGIFTDNANSSIDTNIEFQRLEAIDLMGVSLAFDTELIELPFTFGAYYKFGDGKVRIADTRSVENIVGLPLYPQNNNSDIADASRGTVVAYFSVNF